MKLQMIPTALQELGLQEYFKKSGLEDLPGPFNYSSNTNNSTSESTNNNTTDDSSDSLIVVIVITMAIKITRRRTSLCKDLGCSCFVGRVQ